MKVSKPPSTFRRFVPFTQEFFAQKPYQGAAITAIEGIGVGMGMVAIGMPMGYNLMLSSTLLAGGGSVISYFEERKKANEAKKGHK
jgi:hypothetical protein